MKEFLNTSLLKLKSSRYLDRQVSFESNNDVDGLIFLVISLIENILHDLDGGSNFMVSNEWKCEDRIEKDYWCCLYGLLVNTSQQSCF